MAAEYTREIMKVVVAKICQTIGWHSIHSTPLDILVDILRRYFIELTGQTHAYATQFGHAQPNLDELGLAFRDMHINIADLEEYVQYVDSAPTLDVPSYPVPKESHLNFLKPGSNEVVTRPVHIHEHLPPMLPDMEEKVSTITAVNKEDSPSPPSTETSTNVFKRPADITTPIDTPNKRPRLLMEEEGRPTREISSVMMTTSGFLSPAREGKLPEARTPISAVDPMIPISMHSASHSNANSEPRFERKGAKTVKDMKKLEKRKDRASKELFKPIQDDPSIKKITTMKDVVKMKAFNKLNNVGNVVTPVDVGNKPANPSIGKASSSSKAPSSAVKPKVQKTPKNEKPIASSSPIPSPIKQTPVHSEKVVEGKLSSEPDKVKLNIFKKISKVKDDKIEKSKTKEELRSNDLISQASRESSPDLIIDESDVKNWDQTRGMPLKTFDIPIKAETFDLKSTKSANLDINTKMYDAVKSSPRSDSKDFIFDDYMSPPGTPSTPKTPEMPLQSPPIKAEKRKRKDKTKVKNKSKALKNSGGSRIKAEKVEMELDRPKTPDDPVNLVKSEPPCPMPGAPVFPFFPSLTGGPSLIPPPMTNPLFPRMPLPVNLAKHGFGQPAHIPTMPILPFVPTSKPVEDLPEKTLPVTPEPTIKIEKSELVNIKEPKHKKDKKDKIKKKNKKDKIKNKSEKRKLKEEKREKEKDKEKIKKEKRDKKREKERENEGSVPKITLKISSPRPPTPDAQIARKIMIKPVVKKEEEPQSSTTAAIESQDTREPSPELARISALITRPPKLKPSTTTVVDKSYKLSTSPVDIPIPSFHAKLKKSMFRAIPKIKCKEMKKSDETDSEVTDTDIQISQPPSLPASAAFYFDNDGNKVWICPACGGQDDGSPMIGCDDCDAWYHWVCVGIQVPPDANEDWYCRICIVKKQETLQIDKKKKRKKKERKDH